MKLLHYGKTVERGIVSFHCRRQSPRTCLERLWST